MTLSQLAGTLILELGLDDPRAKRIAAALGSGNLRTVRALIRSHLQSEERHAEAKLEAVRVQLRVLEAAELGRPEALALKGRP